MINFTVYGEPQGKARPRFRKVGNFVQTYTPQKTKSYEDEIKMFAKAAMGATEPLETPVEVFLYIRNSVPASYSKNALRLVYLVKKNQLTKQTLTTLPRLF